MDAEGEKHQDHSDHRKGHGRRFARQGKITPDAGDQAQRRPEEERALLHGQSGPCSVEPASPLFTVSDGEILNPVGHATPLTRALPLC